MLHLKRLFLLLILSVAGLLVGCTAQSDDLTEIALIELQTENKRLERRLSEATDTLRQINSSQQGLVTQQIIAKEVTFAGGDDTVQSIRDRRTLRCGGNADLPGFGFLDPDQGDFIGFDVDICRVIAAAVLGDQGADQIEITPLTSRLRFASLQSGEIDVLTRNTTWTMSRDTELGSDYAAVTFYDGQGIMVRESSGIQKLSDLRNKAVCVQEGSTSATNIVDYFENIGITIEVREFSDRIAARNQYEDGACDGYTGDKSSLIAQQILLAEPEAHKILVEDLSREPLGPVVRHGDDNWKDIVTWSIQCTINAEFLGISQENVEDELASDQLVVKQLLGLEGELGKKIGLPNDFCYQIIRQVGNYADIYARHLGSDTPFNLPRGLNALYVDGGLLYPLPFK